MTKADPPNHVWVYYLASSLHQKSVDLNQQQALKIKSHRWCPPSDMAVGL